MTNKGVIVSFPVKEEVKKTNTFLKFIDGDGFDKMLGKVTNGLFSVIIFLGIPYFFHVLLQAFFIR